MLLIATAMTTWLGTVFPPYPNPLEVETLTAALLALVIVAAGAAITVVYLKFIQPLLAQSHKKKARDLQKLNRALSKLSTSKVLFTEDLTSVVHELTEICASTLEVERVGAWIFCEDHSKCSALDLYERSLNRHSSGFELSYQECAGFFDIMVSNRVGVANDVQNNPLTVTVCRLKDLGITSAMCASLFVNGKFHGILTVGHTGRKREWSSDEQNFAASLADMIAMAFEVDERKRIERELRVKSHAIEASVDGMAIVDNQEQFSFVNKALARIYGYNDPEELIGKNWRILCDTEETRRFEHHLVTTFRRTGNLQIEAIGRRKDGSQFPQELSLTVLSEGGFIYVVRDVTKRKEAQLSLIENRLFLRKVIDTDPHFIFVKDSEGRFTLANQAVAEAYGTSVNNLLGKNDAQFSSQMDEVERFFESDRYVLETGQELFIPEEKLTDSKGKTRWLQTIKRPLQLSSSQKVHVLGVSTDITESKKLHEQLIQSQKMEAFGQLAGGIAHDFNNMMTGILGYTTLLKISNQENQEVFRNADMIEQAANRAADLTRKLLAFAKHGKNQDVHVDLHTSVKDTLAIISRTLEKNINIIVNLAAESPFIMGDPTQIQQVLLNLAINARDAMSREHGGTDGGDLIIESRMVDSSHSQQGFRPHHGQLWVEVVFSDTGCGIDQENIEKIFEPFFTTKGESRGTGLGLAMVYGIVKNHNGTVRVTSEKGRGSKFIISFPSVPPPAINLPDKTEIKVAQGQGTILVVDDHQLILDVTSRMLNSLGYQVVTAIDGLEAVDYYKNNHQKVDLIIIDMIMPRMGARECFKAIRTINPTAKAVLSTGYLDPQTVQEMLNNGMIGFVQKPYRLDSLSHVVATALAN